ncbi:MAG: hypothetical protein J1F60_00100 [Oscillospiraceae bacterium]|nr:hypothetical protein [Oscillospiraceae bacterium]
MSIKVNNSFSSNIAANVSKKENKPFNKENAAAKAPSKKFDKLTISGEGAKSYRKSISESEQPLTYDNMRRQKKILSGGINYSYNLSQEADKLGKADEEALTEGSTLSWQTKLDNLGKAYQNLRDEIVQGYENGTRQVNVIDETSETGYRTLTMEEELSALDAAYEKNVKAFEELAAQQEQAGMIIDEWREQVAELKEEKSSEQSVEEQEEQTEREESEKDENKSSGMVGINAGKLARMLAAAKTRSQVQAVMSKIQSDLSECEAGKNQGMDVDEESVKAAKQLLQEAKARMGSAENREATPQEEMAAAIASLM